MVLKFSYSVIAFRFRSHVLLSQRSYKEAQCSKYFACSRVRIADIRTESASEAPLRSVSQVEQRKKKVKKEILRTSFSTIDQGLNLLNLLKFGAMFFAPLYDSFFLAESQAAGDCPVSFLNTRKKVDRERNPHSTEILSIV